MLAGETLFIPATHICINKQGNSWVSYQMEPLPQTWMNLNPGNYIHYKVLDEITYPFPNINGAANALHGHMITYSWWDQS